MAAAPSDAPAPDKTPGTEQEHPEAPFLTDDIMDNIRHASSFEELKTALLTAFSAINAYPSHYSESLGEVQRAGEQSARRMTNVERKTRQMSKGLRGE